MRGIKNTGKLKKGLITSLLKSEISNAEYNYIKYFKNDNGSSNNNVSNNTDASTNTNASNVSNNTNVSNNSNVSNSNTDDDT